MPKIKIPDDKTLEERYNVKFYGRRPPAKAVRDYCKMFDKVAEERGSRHGIQEFRPWYRGVGHKYEPPFLSQGELDELVNGDIK